ncbi:MAG: LacI family DNA-binding transcriptional regulator [Planctomycetota bacterium]|nr:LacI family DNA-binding transcriptional regulator [Planctomycetota bacterium]
MSRQASIEDVAEAAKVSTATVSRVINSPNLVAPDTAAKVLKAIRELEYRPNLFAKGLSTKRSRVLGIALPDIHGEFYSELLRGADSAARDAGYHLLVSSEGRITGNGNGGSQQLVFGLVDGLAVMITEAADEIWAQLEKTSVPVVVLDVAARVPQLNSIVVDNELGTREATEHLLDSVPPERCYFVGGPDKNYDTQGRQRAFTRVLSERGHAARTDQVAFGSYTIDWGRQWADMHLSRITRGKPVGILAGNDEIAYGIMQTAQDASLAIPGDIRLVGFDDSRLAILVRPRLSSVRVPAAEIGAAAVRTLVEHLASPSDPPARVSLASSLIVRESSQAPALNAPGARGTR